MRDSSYGVPPRDSPARSHTWSRLEQFDRVPVGIEQLNLLAAEADNKNASKLQAAVFIAATTDDSYAPAGTRRFHPPDSCCWPFGSRRAPELPGPLRRTSVPPHDAFAKASMSCNIRRHATGMNPELQNENAHCRIGRAR
jgi:hypothetical protein